MSPDFADGDIVKYVDILGHSNIGTTRIYLLSTGAEHMEQLDESPEPNLLTALDNRILQKTHVLTE